MIKKSLLGALTSKPHAFIMRSWEVRRISTISIIDSWHYNIVIGYRGTDIIRVLPEIVNTKVNNWIPDTTRYMFDGLRKRRLKMPRVSKNLESVVISWSNSYKILNQIVKFPTTFIQGIAGYSIDLETVIIFKRLIELIGGYGIYTDYGYLINKHDFRSKIMFVDQYENWKEQDLFLLLGTNIRIDAPLLAMFITNQRQVDIISVASCNALPIPYIDAGFNINAFVDGIRTECYNITRSQKLRFISGMNTAYYNCNVINEIIIKNLYYSANISDKMGTTVVTQNTIVAYANHMAIYEMGVEYIDDLYKKKTSLTLSIEADECDLSSHEGSHFTVYIGASADVNAPKSNLTFPSSIYTESNGTFINTEGKVQKAHALFEPLANAQSQWRILNIMMLLLNDKITFPYINHPITSMTTQISDTNRFKVDEQLKDTDLYLKAKEIIENVILNIFEANTILRMSTLLALASRSGSYELEPLK